MNNKILQIIIFLVFFFSQSIISYAYDNITTHPKLTERAVEKTEIFKYNLIDYLGLQQGIETKLFGKTTISEWIQIGSTYEDVPDCRASNHFHNPLLPWNESFMTDDTDWLGQRIRSYCEDDGWLISNRKSLITWATGYLAPSPNGPKVKENEWGANHPSNWDVARKYYYEYLTGKDYDGKVTAESDSARKLSLARSFESLGHVLHLIQDVSVPAHVRNDFTSHLMLQNIGFSKPKSWAIQPFEYYVKTQGTDIIKTSPSDAPELGNPGITDFWDTDQFTGGNPSVGLDQGLAEFTNANYLSEFTIPNNSPTAVHQFTYPQINNEDYQLVKENFRTGKRRYIARKNPVIPPPEGKNDTFAAVSVLNKIDEITDANISNIRLFLYDENVNKTYANELIPRSIGYSAALLDYFFRGKIELTNIDFEIDSTAYNSVSLSVLNTTDNNEEMTGGSISMVIRYKTFGQEEFIYKVKEHNANAIPRDVPLDLTFNISEFDIPNTATDMDLFIVFKGQLGNETDAVAVGYYSVLSTLFEEEWDNGLTGNHPWVHQSYHDAGQGIAVNEISDGILNKENRRNAGNEDPCYNESFVSLIDAENPNGILITPNATVQFKIPEMSFAGAPSVYPFQALILIFNNGLRIHYSQEGQQHYWTPETAHYTFNPDLINIDNIYNSFQSQGIAITEPLYLKKIDFLQQLYDLDEPSASEHIQKMKIDFIKIIGGKQ